MPEGIKEGAAVMISDLLGTLSPWLPGERAMVAAFALIEKIIEGQPPEVKKQLWEWYIEDAKAWRQLLGLKV